MLPGIGPPDLFGPTPGPLPLSAGGSVPVRCSSSLIALPGMSPPYRLRLFATGQVPVRARGPVPFLGPLAGRRPDIGLPLPAPLPAGGVLPWGHLLSLIGRAGIVYLPLSAVDFAAAQFGYFLHPALEEIEPGVKPRHQNNSAQEPSENGDAYRGPD